MKHNFKIVASISILLGVGLIWTEFFQYNENYTKANVIINTNPTLTPAFWASNPSDTLIKETIFGDSINFNTFHSQYWVEYTGGTCDETIMNVIKISSGQKIPNILTGNNVYVVEEGIYELTGAGVNTSLFGQKSQILMQGSCIALVASGKVDFYSHQDGTSVDSMIRGYNPLVFAHNYVIDGINLYGNIDSGGNSFGNSIGTGIFFNKINTSSTLEKTINNTSIEGFNFGIQIIESNTNYLYNVTVSGNNFGGIYVRNSQGLGVLFSRVTNNGGRGVDAQGNGTLVIPVPQYTGFVAVPGNSVGVLESMIENNSSGGILFLDYNASVVMQSTIRNNGEYGIFLPQKTQANRTSIFYSSDNTIEGHTKDGILLQSTLFDFISGSIIRNNNENGVFLDKGTAFLATCGFLTSNFKNYSSSFLAQIEANNEKNQKKKLSLFQGAMKLVFENIIGLVSDKTYARIIPPPKGFCGDIVSTINNNLISDNGNNGILSQSGGIHYIYENSIQNNIDDGIRVLRAFSGYINSNIIQLNSGNGMFLSNFDYVGVTKNDVLSNGGDGISSFNFMGGEISYNKVFGSSNFGMKFNETQQTAIYNNISSSNNSGGMILYDMGNSSILPSITNVIHNNMAFNNGICGLLVSAVMNGQNYIFNNQIFNNDYGYCVGTTSKNIFSNNSIYNNSSAGVLLVGTTGNNFAQNYIYNNPIGIIFSGGSNSNFYFGDELFFGNDENLSGSNGHDTIFTGGFNPTNNTTGTLNFSTGIMNCERATIPEHTPLGISNMFFSSTFPLCNNRGRLTGWSSLTGDSYTFFENIPLQIQPFALIPTLYLIPANIVFFNTGMHIGDFFNSSLEDVNQQSYIGGTSYIRSDNGYLLSNDPLTLGLKIRTSGDTIFELSGGFYSDFIGNINVIGDVQNNIILGVNGLQSTGNFSPTNGLKFIRSQFTGSGLGGTLFSNFYGNLRILNNNSISVTKTPSAKSVIIGQPITYTILFKNDTTSILTDIIVTDILGTGLAYLTSTATPQVVPQSPVVSGNIVTRTGFTSLNPGETGQVIVTVLLTGAGNKTIFNDVIVSSNGLTGTASSSVCDNGATNPPICSIGTITSGCTGSCCGGGCGDDPCGNSVLQVGEQCDFNDPDINKKLKPGEYCTNRCTIGNVQPDSTPTFNSAPLVSPIGIGCKYNDYHYQDNGAFRDTLSDRSFPYVEILRLNCIVKGKGSEGIWKFYTNDIVTLDEALKMLVKIEGITSNFSSQKEERIFNGSIPFSNITSDYRFAQYSSPAQKLGLTQDFETKIAPSLFNLYSSQTTLNYRKLLTRNEAIKLMVTTYRKINGNNYDANFVTNFSDVKKSSKYYQYIVTAEQLGFINGMSEAGRISFNGNSLITRAAFAKIIAGMFKNQLYIVVDETVANSEIYKKIVSEFKRSKKNRQALINDLLYTLQQIDDASFKEKTGLPKQTFINSLQTLLLKDDSIKTVKF